VSTGALLVSPLEERGFSAGGLGGAPLLPLVADWVKRVRVAGFTKHINAGGGVLCANDVDTLADAGADSVFLGSIAMLRGWRVRSAIKRAHKRLGKKI
jgi:dihydroorotate dehydrogenase